VYPIVYTFTIRCLEDCEKMPDCNKITAKYLSFITIYLLGYQM
jgi:hypothetical protein